MMAAACLFDRTGRLRQAVPVISVLRRSSGLPFSLTLAISFLTRGVTMTSRRPRKAFALKN